MSLTEQREGIGMRGMLVLPFRPAARLALRAGHNPVDARDGAAPWSVPTAVGLLSAFTGPVMRRFHRRRGMA